MNDGRPAGSVPAPHSQCQYPVVSFPCIDPVQDPFRTFTAFNPLGPFSTSNVTLSPSLICSVSWFTCTKTRSWLCRSLINPKPFASLKKETTPRRWVSSSVATYLGVLIWISSWLYVRFLLGS